MKYKIVGVHWERDEHTRSLRLVKTELFREDFPHALVVRDSLRELGWLATIRPTPEIWTEELVLT